MLDRAEILRTLATRRDLLRRYGVRSLAVFGSIARDNYGAESDVDLLVEYDEAAGTTLLDVLRLQDELEAIIGRKVQIVTDAALRPHARAEIARDMVNVF